MSKEKKPDVTELSADEMLARILGQTEAYDWVMWEGIGRVRVYSLSLKEKAAFEKETSRRRRKKEPIQFRERLLIQTVRSEDGKPLFNESHMTQLGQVASRSAERVFTVACKITGFIDEDDEIDEGN